MPDDSGDSATNGSKQEAVYAPACNDYSVRDYDYDTHLSSEEADVIENWDQ